MTDQELLELAAKAAGIDGWYEREYLSFIKRSGGPWRPLEDDGDALRLLTKLAFRELYISEIEASVSWRRGGSPHGFKCDEYASEHGGDLNVATRRAIVRAAAALALDEGEEKWP